MLLLEVQYVTIQPVLNQLGFKLDSAFLASLTEIVVYYHVNRSRAGTASSSWGVVLSIFLGLCFLGLGVLVAWLSSSRDCVDGCYSRGTLAHPC
eukprot:COSAG02_NODE_2900_length_7779_cov_3.635547_6_plen_94_part_00